MRLSQAEAINSEIDQTAEHLAGLMNVKPEWIQEHGPVTVIYPMSVSSDRRTASFSMENGVPVDKNSAAVQPFNRSLLASIDAYDEDLVPTGLRYLASPDSQMTAYIGSIEGGVDEKSRLTSGFIEGIKSLAEVGSAEVGTLPRKTAKELGRKTVGLVKTLGIVIVKHPEHIHLPEESPTQAQAVALNGLMHLFNGRRLSDFREMADRIIENTDGLPVVDTEEWQEELRLFRLGWRTTEEIEDYRKFLREAASNARRSR